MVERQLPKLNVVGSIPIARSSFGGFVTLKVKVDREKCQGHARCFALAPELFELDEMGNGRERGDGRVTPGLEAKAHLAQANCPELAVEVIEEKRR